MRFSVRGCGYVTQPKVSCEIGFLKCLAINFLKIVSDISSGKSS